MTEKSRKILIVEDEPEVAETMARQLERLGYNVVGTVASGERAIEEAQVKSPDLILMDIQLEGAIDGIEAGQKLQDRFNIVYMTGFVDKVKSIQEQGRAPLVKPFTINDLKIAIDVVFLTSDKKDS